MRKYMGILLIVFGLSFFAWNSMMMYLQIKTVEHNPVKAKAIDDHWKIQTREESIIEAEQEEQPIPKYSFKRGERIAQLTIPKLGNLIPVYYGTDLETLKSGAGMYDTNYTVLPTEDRHTALAGHSDTVFSGLKHLEIGDRLYLVFDNIKYEYQIRAIWITDKKDKGVLVDKNTPTLTLTTCYPFHLITLAPKRYIVQSELVHKEAVM